MIKINLLPPEKRKKLKRVKPSKKKFAGAGIKLDLKWDPYMVVPALLGVVTIGLIAGSFFFLRNKEKSFKIERDQIRVELNKMTRVRRKIENLKVQTVKVRNRMEIILQVDQNRFLWPRILDEISSAMPRYSWLESISELTPWPELTLRLEGITMSNVLLSRLLTNFENSELLTGIKLISSEERLYGDLETKFFTIECACMLNQPADTTEVAAAR